MSGFAMSQMVGLVLVAAGEGRRFGGPPKQFRRIGRETMLRRALDALRAYGRDWPAVVVHGPDREADARAALAGVADIRFVLGAEDRQGSAKAGLEAFADSGLDAVLIHDAARPFPTPALVDAVLAALSDADGAIPTIPVVDSLKSIDAGGRIVGVVDRDGLGCAQTPQAFRFDPILKAHRAARPGHTDDASVAAAAGLTIKATPGDPGNVKITVGADLRDARARIETADAMELRVGEGFDVHRFGPGTAVRLCGVDLPHDQALTGHSDADVAWHALTDALFGAIGEGDIGRWFPPSERRWTGADSAIFLAAAVDRIAQRGGRIVNIDLTVIGERPKVGPYAAAMRERTADVLGLHPGAVNVKATTTEKLGFPGREEGLAARAACLVRLPVGA